MVNQKRLTPDDFISHRNSSPMAHFEKANGRELLIKKFTDTDKKILGKDKFSKGLHIRKRLCVNVCLQRDGYYHVVDTTRWYPRGVRDPGALLYTVSA